MNHPPTPGRLPEAPRAADPAAGQGAAGPASLHDVDDRLAAIRDLPLDRHVPEFTALHERLAAALAVTDSSSEDSLRAPDAPPRSG